MKKVAFTIPYDGGRAINIDGKVVGYIDRSVDGPAWVYEGRRFRYLSEAKATVVYELEDEE